MRFRRDSRRCGRAATRRSSVISKSEPQYPSPSICCIAYSGKSWDPTKVASRTMIWLNKSRRTLVRLPHSSPASPRWPTVWRPGDGSFWLGSRGIANSPSSTPEINGCKPNPRRLCCWRSTSGSMPTTSGTNTVVSNTFTTGGIPFIGREWLNASPWRRALVYTRPEDAGT